MLDLLFYFFLFILGLVIGLTIWSVRLYKLYKAGKRKSFTIQICILTALIVFATWELQIFPLSENFYIKEQTTKLTGKSFWSWKEFSYDELGIRGEGYTLYIYKFSQETADYFSNPNSLFFSTFPRKTESDIKWTKTPVKKEDLKILEFVTPIYIGWKSEIIARQDFIKKIATRKGAYYAYKDGGGTDFFIISPKDRLVILINHDM
jgi:hypothetical protein